MSLKPQNFNPRVIPQEVYLMIHQDVSEAINDIENEHYNTALKSLDKLIAQHGEYHTLISFKAICVSLLSDRAESLDIISPILKAGTFDITVLSNIATVLNKANKSFELADFYEKIVKVNPKGKETRLMLFNEYIRNCDFLKSQKLAFRLFNSFKDTTYLMYSVCCFLVAFELGFLNDKCGKFAQFKLSKLLKLSMEQKVVKNALESFHGFGSSLGVLALYAELMRVFSVEKTLSKEKEIVSFAAKCIGLMESYKEQNDSFYRFGLVLTELCSENNLLEQSLDVLKILMGKWPDQWELKAKFLNTVFLLSSTCDFEGKNTFIATLSKAIRDETFSRSPGYPIFIQCLKLKCPSSLLGFNLTLSVLCYSVLREERADFREFSEGQIEAVLVRFFQEFGGKLCFFDESKRYLAFLARDGSLDYAERVLGKLEGGLAAVKNKENGVLNIEKLRRFSGLVIHKPELELKKYVSELFSHFLEAKLKKEVSEDFAILTTMALCDLYGKSRSVSHLLEAVAVLQCALKNSKSHKLLFLAFKLSFRVQIFSPQLDFLAKVYNILCENMSTHLITPLETFGFFDKLQSFTEKFAKLSATNFENAGNTVGKFLSKRDYFNARDIMTFNHKLKNSIGAARSSLALFKQKLVPLFKSNYSFDKISAHFERYFGEFKPFLPYKHDQREIDLSPDTFRGFVDNTDFDFLSEICGDSSKDFIWRPLVSRKRDFSSGLPIRESSKKYTILKNSALNSLVAVRQLGVLVSGQLVKGCSGECARYLEMLKSEINTLKGLENEYNAFFEGHFSFELAHWELTLNFFEIAVSVSENKLTEMGLFGQMVEGIFASIKRCSFWGEVVAKVSLVAFNAMIFISTVFLVFGKRGLKANLMSEVAHLFLFHLEKLSSISCSERLLKWEVCSDDLCCLVEKGSDSYLESVKQSKDEMDRKAKKHFDGLVEVLNDLCVPLKSWLK